MDLAFPTGTMLVNYLGDDHDRGISPHIKNHILAGPDGQKPFYGVFDDFLGYNYLASTGVFGNGPYLGFIENSGTITDRVNVTGGVIRLTTGTTADNDCSFSAGGGATAAGAAPFKLGVGTPGTLTADGTKLVAEWRFAAPDVTQVRSFFVGLTQEQRAQNDGFITDAHALAAVDMLGFFCLDSDPDSLKFGYSVGSGSPVTLLTWGNMTDNTMVKGGFVYDPKAFDATKALSVYVNNVEQSTYIPLTTIQASTFPGGEEMNWGASVKTDACAAATLDIDWGFVAQCAL